MVTEELQSILPRVVDKENENNPAFKLTFLDFDLKKYINPHITVHIQGFEGSWQNIMKKNNSREGALGTLLAFCLDSAN